MPIPAAGYSATRLAVWQADLRSSFRTALDLVTPGLGATVNLDAGSVLGRILDALAARLDELAEASQDLYDSFDERNATGVYLDNLARLIGISGRLPATRSTVNVTLTATAACTVPAGSIVADAAGVQWTTQTAHVFAGAGAFVVEARPAAYGPVAAAAGTLTVIVTPITGWGSVTNAADATLGTDRETDSELRSRRRQSLQISGGAAPDAIRAAVLDIDGIDGCRVDDNKTLLTVTLGVGTTIDLPGKSFAVTVSPNGLGATVRAAVAAAIWAKAPAGIEMARMVAADAGAGGGVTETITDGSGNSQTVKFSTAVDQAMTFTVTVVDGDVPETDATIRAVFTDYIDSLLVGEQPVALPIYYGLGALPGIENVTALGIVGAVGAFERAMISNPAADIVIAHI